MNRFTIRSAQDVARISALPYESFMAHGSVYEALRDVASRHAGRTALTYLVDADPASAPRTWTYTELLADIRRTANLFRSLLDGGEPRVALLLPPVPEAYLALWGAEARGLVCPINFMLDADHIAGLVRASKSNILVALGPDPDLDIWSRVPDLARQCPDLRHVLTVGEAPGYPDFLAAVRSQADSELPLRPSLESPEGASLAALFHTGGTTGAPKLAQHTHRNQLHAAWGAAQHYAMDERDVILNGFPLFHVAGSFVFGLSALLSGAEVVLPTMLGMRNSAFVSRYWNFVERHRVTLLSAVPTVMASLLGTDRSGADVSSVRALLTGGSPLPNELANAFERQFGIPVRNILGMTECAGVVSVEPFLSARTPGSCGIALPFTEVKAMVDERECAVGESGILRLRGPNVGPGYTDPRRNAGTFTDDGWLITGDIGHIDGEGRVFVTGRAKDMIIRGGHNIDPQVIEEALLQHPDVLMAAAVGQPDEYAGELPVAFVSLRAGASTDAAVLSSFANARIPERPAFPKRIDVLPSMPMTAIGKVYKPALRALACERVLRERLAAIGLSAEIDVRVADSAGGMQVEFVIKPGGAGPAARRAAVDELMRPF
ncbi:MAG: acyl-CoA synthetase, partial [Burkholderiaceae bacterium]